MTAFAAFLRAVNVGGTGKLPMADLREMCRDIDFSDVSTYIASGNLVFRTSHSSGEAQALLEKRLEDYAGKPVGVLLRTAPDLQAVIDQNPFPEAPGNRVVALLLPDANGSTGTLVPKKQTVEVIETGPGVIYIHYPDGQADSKLVLPEMKTGTARNMNTVSKMLSLVQSLTEMP